MVLIVFILCNVSPMLASITSVNFRQTFFTSIRVQTVTVYVATTKNTQDEVFKLLLNVSYHLKKIHLLKNAL